MTDDLIKRARAAMEGVTPGPWAVDFGETYCDVVTNYPYGDNFVVCEHCHPDARFIAAARDLVPAMINRIEALEAEVARLREAKTVVVKVKPLVWVKHPEKDIWRADTFLGQYKVFGVGKKAPSWDFDSWSDAQDRFSKTETTIEAAKAAAQADYEARILAALDVQPGFTADDLRRAWELAARDIALAAKDELSAAWAADLIAKWCRALTPPADLGDKVKEGRDNG